MLEIKTKNISLISSGPRVKVQGWFVWCPENPPRAILQISHGMCEYSARYGEFAAFMARSGYAVCLHDHPGHGETSNIAGSTDGYFGPGQGAARVLQAILTMNDRARREFPGLPVILLGHSMGSFFARWLAECEPNAIDGLILSGTAGPNPMLGAGIALSGLIARVRGERYRPQCVQKLAFGAYLSRIENPETPHDWISRDREIVRRYAADPKCTFVFTASAFHEMFWVLRQVNRKDWYTRVPVDLPIRLMSGDADPVGDYGKGVETVYNRLMATGHEDTVLRLYEGGRHEMLNEIGREEVYQDVLAWCEEILEKVD